MVYIIQNYVDRQLTFRKPPECNTMNTLDTIKSILRKYLPEGIYRKLYTLWILFLQLDSKNIKKGALLYFTEPTWKKVVVDDVAFEMLLDPKNGSVDKEIYVHGVYEIEILRLLRKYINEHSVCLDIGSNIGQHALFMAKVAKKGKVYAFEPIKSLAEQIIKSKERNNLNNMEIENIGLSDKNEEVVIHINNLNFGMSTIIPREDFSAEETISTRIFTDFWNDRSRIDVVKIDVEGFEYQVLCGMEKCLRKYSPIILFEFSPIFYKKINIQSNKILELLFDIGYRLFDIEKDNKEITRGTVHSFLLSTPHQTNILCLPNDVKNNS